MDRQLVSALKTLADPTRLRLLGRLAERAHRPEELVEATGLPRRVVDRQLGLLVAGGVVARNGDGAYELRVDALQGIGRSLDELAGRADRADGGAAGVGEPAGPDGSPLPDDDARIVRSFIVDGRLTTIPAQERKRLVVLRYLRDACFAEGRDYPEKEVNQRLALFHSDVASLRRYLVDHGLMTRSAGIYRRTSA